MPLLATDAIVLHAFDYLESSRIIRLLTREAGVQSGLARGARKSRGRYGTALDLFAEGSAQLYVKPNRELHNLAGFEISADEKRARRRRRTFHCRIDRGGACSAIRGRGSERAAGRYSRKRLRPHRRLCAGKHHRGRSRCLLASGVRARIHSGAFQLRALSHSASRKRRRDVLARLGRNSLPRLQPTRPGGQEDSFRRTESHRRLARE